MPFGPDFIQPPQRIPFRNPSGSQDNPRGDFTDGEVRLMNEDYQDDERLREVGHND